MLQLQRDTPPSTSSEPLLSRHAACCVFSSTVRTISGWFSSLLSTLQPTRHRGRPTYMSVRKVVTGQALERAGRLIDGLKSFLVFGFNRTTDHTTLRPIEWTRLVCHSGAVYHQLTGFKKTGQMIGDQSNVFSVVVCIWFQTFDWLVEVWRVDTVNRATEVKCYQFFFLSEGSVSAAGLKRTMRSPGDEITGHNVCTQRRQDPIVWTQTTSGLERTRVLKMQSTLVCWRLQRQSLTVLRNLPALLNTSLFKHQTTLLSFSLGRREFEVLRVHGCVHISS